MVLFTSSGGKHQNQIWHSLPQLLSMTLKQYVDEKFTPAIQYFATEEISWISFFNI